MGSGPGCQQHGLIVLSLELQRQGRSSSPFSRPGLPLGCALPSPLPPDQLGDVRNPHDTSAAPVPERNCLGRIETSNQRKRIFLQDVLILLLVVRACCSPPRRTPGARASGEPALAWPVEGADQRRWLIRPKPRPRWARRSSRSTRAERLPIAQGWAMDTLMPAAWCSAA